jgi:hypothetical protein
MHGRSIFYFLEGRKRPNTSYPPGGGFTEWQPEAGIIFDMVHFLPSEIPGEGSAFPPDLSFSVSQE